MLAGVIDGSRAVVHDASPPSPEVCDMDYLRWSKFDLEVPRWYSTLFGYVLVVTTRDMGILALREPGPRLGGRGENEGNQDSDEVGVQSHKPLVEMGPGSSSQDHDIEAHGALSVFGSEYCRRSATCRCSGVRLTLGPVGTAAGHDVAEWALLC